MAALIVVDASLTTRIATELVRRGRAARTLASLGLKELDDDPMLLALAAMLTVPYVLLTADDAMPAVHPQTIAATGTTVATLDRRWQRSRLDHEQYKFEVVQRWAHRIAEQKPGTIYRYSVGGARPWKPPRGR